MVNNDIYDVSVIIINYKTPTLCIDCIKSLEGHSNGFSYEIIVIDNNSQDDSLDIIRGKIGDGPIYVQNKENLGTARSFNQGAKLARGKYLFYLNTDTLFVNNAIKILFEYMEAHPNVAVTGGDLYNSAMKPTHSYNRNYFGMNKIRKINTLHGILESKMAKRIKCNQFNYSNKPIKVDYVCAAATLIKKDVYIKLGGFDEEIFIYGDESLFAYNCLQNGYFSVNVPNAKIIHFEGDSFQKDKNNFSEGRIKRFYQGMTIHVKRIYGDDKVGVYYKYCIHGLKIKSILYRIMLKNGSAVNCLKEINIIKALMK